MIEVIKAGLQTTVQDVGRIGYRHLGMNQCGAMDKYALLLANRLVKNPDNSAALEIGIGYAEFKFTQTCLIAVTGADFFASIDNTPLYSGWRKTINAGQTLTFKSGKYSMRSYLAVAGAIDVTALYGSFATDINAGFGGYHGRALQPGDQLTIGQHVDHPTLATLPSVGIAQPKWNNIIRVTAGPHLENLTSSSQQHVYNSAWQVSNSSNRMGARLSGNTLKLNTALELASQAVMPGVIQVPPAGEPIILLADAQTTGGYPIIAVVIAADLWKIAQSQPGTALHFKQVDFAHAIRVQQQWQRYFNRVQWSIDQHD